MKIPITIEDIIVPNKDDICQFKLVLTKEQDEILKPTDIKYKCLYVCKGYYKGCDYYYKHKRIA